jgi:hypothetical protein
VQTTDPDAHFRDLVRQQIIDAYSLDAEAVEEIFSTESGSYGAARLEYDAEFERMKAKIEAHRYRTARELALQLRASGVLPEDCRFEWTAGVDA